MGFQSTIAALLGAGVPGELAFEGPLRAKPGVVKGTAANIVVGRWFTIDPADGAYAPGTTGGAGGGGLLVNPKVYASVGTAANGPLAPTMTLPANTVGEFATMGEFWVSLSNAAALGAGVYFDNTTGALSAGTAGAGQTQIADAVVVRYANAAAGLAVVSFTGP